MSKKDDTIKALKKKIKKLKAELEALRPSGKAAGKKADTKKDKDKPKAEAKGKDKDKSKAKDKEKQPKAKKEKKKAAQGKPAVAKAEPPKLGPKSDPKSEAMKVIGKQTVAGMLPRVVTG